MNYLVVYDVVEDKVRNKLIKSLSKYGRRVQFSCFEITLTKKDFDLLVNELSKIVDHKIDSLIFYPLSTYSENSVIKYGEDIEIERGRVV